MGDRGAGGGQEHPAWEGEVMLDFNSTSTFPERFEALIDAGLQAREQRRDGRAERALVAAAARELIRIGL